MLAIGEKVETSDMSVLILGGSKGLGLALKQQYESRGIEVRAISRTTQPRVDFSKMSAASDAIQTLRNFHPSKIVYCAGGGPHGEFGSKKFKDHEWAFAVGFLFPAFLLHDICANRKEWGDLKQVCMIGSAIAGAKPDPLAASYSAAKHALVGLVESVQNEPHGDLDIRLFSPGYMDTSLLPKNAWPRQVGARVLSPEKVAEFLASWLENPDPANQHQVFE